MPPWYPMVFDDKRSHFWPIFLGYPAASSPVTGWSWQWKSHPSINKHPFYIPLPFGNQSMGREVFFWSTPWRFLTGNHWRKWCTVHCHVYLPEAGGYGVPKWTKPVINLFPRVPIIGERNDIEIFGDNSVGDCQNSLQSGWWEFHFYINHLLITSLWRPHLIWSWNQRLKAWIKNHSYPSVYNTLRTKMDSSSFIIPAEDPSVAAAASVLGWAGELFHVFSVFFRASPIFLVSSLNLEHGDICSEWAIYYHLPCAIPSPASHGGSECSNILKFQFLPTIHLALTKIDRRTGWIFSNFVQHTGIVIHLSIIHP